MDEITKRQVTIMKKRRKEMGFTQGDIAEEAGTPSATHLKAD